MDAIPGDVLASPLSAAATVLRLLSYAMTLVAAGGMLFAAVIAERRPRDRSRLARGVTAAALVASLATVAGVAVHAVLLTGRGAAAVADADVMAAVLGSTFGASAAVRVGALAVIAVAMAFAWRRWALAVGLGAAVAASGSFLLTGHTVDAEPAWLAVASALSHTVAAAAWFGGLAFLVLTLRARSGDGDAAGRAGLVKRFSAMATIAVVVVSLAGAARVPTVMRVDRAVLESAYGLTLVAKVVLVGLVLLVAGYNHRRLVPAIQAAHGGAEQRLRTTIRVEVAVLVVVIALSALLADLSPPGPPTAGGGPSPAPVASG